MPHTVGCADPSTVGGGVHSSTMTMVMVSPLRESEHQYISSFWTNGWSQNLRNAPSRFHARKC